MKRLLAKTIHKLAPAFFEKKSYGYLATWGIEDVFEGKLIFNEA